MIIHKPSFTNAVTLNQVPMYLLYVSIVFLNLVNLPYLGLDIGDVNYPCASLTADSHRLYVRLPRLIQSSLLWRLLRGAAQEDTLQMKRSD